jgi:hypothetical protein
LRKIFWNVNIFENIFWGLSEDLNLNVQYFLNVLLLQLNNFILIVGIILYFKKILLNKNYLLGAAFLLNIIFHLPSLTHIHRRMGYDTTAYINQAG